MIFRFLFRKSIHRYKNQENELYKKIRQLNRKTANHEKKLVSKTHFGVTMYKNRKIFNILFFFCENHSRVALNNFKGNMNLFP